MREYGKKNFILNMLLMTGAMLIIRVLGMVSNIYFTSVIGADSTGMYHLIFSVYGFAVTFSVSGTGLAATRLVSEIGSSSGSGCNAVIRKCLSICISMAVAAALFMWFFAEKLSLSLFDSTNGGKALALLSVSLPAVAISSVLRGYFMAARKVATATVSQLSEEIISMAITLYFLSLLKGTPHGYISMIVGITFSSLIVAVFDIIMYRICISATSGGDSLPPPGYRDIFAISVPVALGSYLRSALISAENILIPKRLTLSGLADSLGEYGIIKGMSIPLMLFPTVFIGSFATMLVPELADRRANQKPNGIRYICAKAVETTLYFAFVASAILITCHDALGKRFYENSKVGTYLGMLALLVIPMYLDTVVDSMLKGLGEQVSSLKYNIADSCLRVAFIWFAVPRYGILSYIFLLYASEIFNLWLSLSRLIKVTGLKLGTGIFLRPLIISLGAYMMSRSFDGGILMQTGVFIASYPALAILSGSVHRRSE